MMKAIKMVFVCVATMLCTPAQAAIIEWSFTAVIRDLNAGPALTDELATLGVVEGTEISGTMLVDDSTTFTALSGIRLYESFLVGASFSIGDLEIGFDETNYNLTLVYRTAVEAIEAGTSVSIDNLDGVSGIGFLELYDADRMIIDGLEFPALPELSELDPYAPTGFGTRFNFAFQGPDDPPLGAFQAELTSLSATVVPVPGAALLFGGALLTLIGASRRG